MSKTIAAFAWCLLVAAAAHAGWVKSTKEVSVPVGRLARVPIEVDADESDYRILGENVDGFREYDPDARKLKLCVLGYESGTAYVVVVGQKGGKLLPPEIITVKVGNGPKPPPDPIPDPPPGPGPDADVVAMAVKLKEAANADKWGAANLKSLGVAFSACPRLVNDGLTSGRAFVMFNAVLKSILVEPVPAKVRAAYATELLWLPTDESHVLTADERAKLVKTFEKLTAACERAAK